MRPLEGVFVLDFSTLLPGPLATLLLAEAGAEVVKVEPPGRGEEMRGHGLSHASSRDETKQPRASAPGDRFALRARRLRVVKE